MKPEQNNQAASDYSAEEASPPQRDKLWTPVFVFVIAISMCSFMTSQGLNSGTTVYLDRIGFDTTVAGVSAALFSISAAVTRLIAGPILDKRGRYAFCLAGLGILIASTFVCSLGLHMNALLACRVLQGFGFAIGTTSAATMAADVLPISRMGEGIGYFGLGQAIAMSIGPALAMFLVNSDRPENLYLGLAVLSTCAFVMASQCNYEKHPEKLVPQAAHLKKMERIASGEAPATHKLSLRNMFHPGAMRAAIPSLIMGPVFGFNIYFVGLLGTSLGVGNAGIYYTMSAIVMIVVRLVASRIMDRIAPAKLLTFGVVCGLGAYALLHHVSGMGPSPTTTALFFVAGAVFGLYSGVTMPITQTVAVKCTPPEIWGEANALTLLAVDVGIGIACIVWGYVNATFGFGASIFGCMGCMATALLAGWILYPRN